MDIKDVEIFCSIAETGNLTRAADRLKLTTMKVSRRLAQLEEELGVRLFQRTTRALSLTNEGEEFLPFAHRLIETESTAKSMFSTEAQRAYGLLRITAPSGIGRRYILPLLPDFMAANPELQIELSLSEDMTDIVSQGYDIAIRVAPLKDSQLIAHKIVENPRILCASPAYIQQYGQPTNLDELRAHYCLKLSTVPNWTFEAEDLHETLNPTGRFTCSNVDGIREMCLAGAGIAQLTVLDVFHELQSGRLVAINLADVQSQTLSVWALTPSRQYTPLRVTAFLRVLKQSLGEYALGQKHE